MHFNDDAAIDAEVHRAVYAKRATRKWTVCSARHDMSSYLSYLSYAMFYIRRRYAMVDFHRGKRIFHTIFNNFKQFYLDFNEFCEKCNPI